MAKISAEERAANKERFDAVVESIFWDTGWESITLNSVAARAGVSKSTIQNYYRQKKDFGEVLRGKAFPVVLEALDITDEQSFKVSWETSLLTNRRFRMVVDLLIANSISETTNDMTIQGIVRLRHHLAEAWQNEKQAYDAILWVLGLSVVKLAEST